MEPLKHIEDIPPSEKNEKFKSKIDYYGTEFLISNTLHYVPTKDDNILAHIVAVRSDHYILRDHTNMRYILDKLGFKNATKRNRPLLKKGDVVFGFIQEVYGEEVLISCIKDEYGPVINGYLFHIGLEKMRSIYFTELNNADTVDIEFYVGNNGYLYIKSQRCTAIKDFLKKNALY